MDTIAIVVITAVVVAGGIWMATRPPSKHDENHPPT